jgi:hypothetical protein
MIDYKNVPSELRLSSLVLEEVSNVLQNEFAREFNGWLEKCIRDHCPEALSAYEKGELLEATMILNRSDFYYATRPGNRYEFRHGNKILARCVIQWNIYAELEKEPIFDQYLHP